MIKTLYPKRNEIYFTANPQKKDILKDYPSVKDPVLFITDSSLNAQIAGFVVPLDLGIIDNLIGQLKNVREEVRGNYSKNHMCSPSLSLDSEEETINLHKELSNLISGKDISKYPVTEEILKFVKIFIDN